MQTTSVTFGKLIKANYPVHLYARISDKQVGDIARFYRETRKDLLKIKGVNRADIFTGTSAVTFFVSTGKGNQPIDTKVEKFLKNKGYTCISGSGIYSGEVTPREIGHQNFKQVQGIPNKAHLFQLQGGNMWTHVTEINPNCALPADFNIAALADNAHLLMPSRSSGGGSVIKNRKVRPRGRRVLKK